MKLKVGDSVAVIDEDLSGVIQNIKNNMVSIETSDGFLLDYEVHEVVNISYKDNLIKETLKENRLKQAILEKEATKIKTITKLAKKDRIQNSIEVDLHIHNLIKSNKGLSNFDMLNIQLHTAKHKLEYAIKKRIQRIIFIHGVGQGVLKLELETLFRRYDNLKYYEANYQKYGLGATEVYLFQNQN